jgi:hypothetical protein
MVASVDNELLSQALLTPRPDLIDSDDVLLAIETARALEIQGELREAVRWLRRAADDAEKQGNDERVLVLARAAADMSNMIGAASDAAQAPTIPPSPPGPIEAVDAQYPPTTPPPESFEGTIPPPASAAPTLPPTFSSAPETVSSPRESLVAARSQRIGAIRVAILESSIHAAKSFFVERLEKGQLAPAGATEAMLVFSSEAADSVEQEVDLLAASDSARF